jgi:putative tricarboxylic transport membrane protein
MLERAVALTVLALSGAYLTKALALPYGTTARPGAGFFPTLVAIFGGIVGLVMTARAFMVPAAAAPRAHTELTAVERGRVASTVVVLLAFCLLLPWAGYPLVAFGFVAVLLRRLGTAWPTAAIVGALSAAVSHYLFAVLLDVPLPHGPW